MIDLPCDCEAPYEPTRVVLYTINSARSRLQIIADHAAKHDLSAKQVDELVKQLPDYGLRSMLSGSLAATEEPEVTQADWDKAVNDLEAGMKATSRKLHQAIDAMESNIISFKPKMLVRKVSSL